MKNVSGGVSQSRENPLIFALKGKTFANLWGEGGEDSSDRASLFGPGTALRAETLFPPTEVSTNEPNFRLLVFKENPP